VTSGLAVPERRTSRVAGITARATVDTPKRRQVMIARFAVELVSDAHFLTSVSLGYESLYCALNPISYPVSVNSLYETSLNFNSNVLLL